MLKPLLKIGVIVAFVAALVIYIAWSMRVPPPREQDRVAHRDGAYSIIPPRDWEVSFNAKPGDRYIDTLEIRRPTTAARDRRIFIGRFRAEPNLGKIAPRDRPIDNRFQGRPAHVAIGRTRLEHYWRAIFERDGQWYELVFWMPYEEDIPDSGWWPYLQSFEAKRAAPTVPSTSPTAQ